MTSLLESRAGKVVRASLGTIAFSHPRSQALPGNALSARLCLRNLSARLRWGLSAWERLSAKLCLGQLVRQAWLGPDVAAGLLTPRRWFNSATEWSKAGTVGTDLGKALDLLGLQLGDLLRPGPDHGSALRMRLLRELKRL